MPALLHDSLLQFDRGGHHLLVVDPAGIAIIDLRRGAIERNECHGAARHELLHRARAVAGFSDQVWVVTLGDVLLRFDLSGRWIGEPITLPSCADATLVPAPCGSAGAIWSAAPAVGFVDDLGSLAQHAHAAADLVIPFTARRAIAVFGARVQLPSGLHATLPPGCRVLGGQVLADGKSAALITANDGRRLVSMVQLGTGQAIARGEIAPAPIRIASRRAIAVVAAEGRRIEVVDLRAGRELGSFVLDREPDELAIDPDGLRLAVRTGHEVELVDLVERLRERPRPVEDVAGAQMTQELAPVPARRLARASEPVVAVGDIGNALANEVANDVARDVPNEVAIELTTEPLIALAPCRPAPLPKQLARASLELEREMILARGLAGIASGWDTRRLGYANESAHPFELEVAALLGASHGHAASHVTEAERRLEVARTSSI